MLSHIKFQQNLIHTIFMYFNNHITIQIKLYESIIQLVNSQQELLQILSIKRVVTNICHV